MELSLGQPAARRRLLLHVPWSVVGVAAVIAALGLWNLASAAREARTAVWESQLVWIGLGALLCAAVCFVDYRYLLRIAWPLYAVTLVLLFVVLFKGRTIMGAQRWLELGPLRVQPSELAKLAVVISLAKFFHEDERRVLGYELHHLWQPMLIVAVPAALILKQPDLGTAIIVAAIGAAVVLFARVRWHAVVAAAALGVLAGWVVWRDLHLSPGERAWILRKEYQKRRVQSFLDPESDALGAAYHANQSVIAVGSGRFSGKGWSKGTQTQLSFLPAQHTDFVFSVWAEEQGFLGAAGVLLLYLWLLALILSVAAGAREKFGTFLCAGVSAMFFAPAFINIGMVTKLVPVVGVPLPLMSYGGSWVVVLWLGLGLVASVGMRRMPR